MATARKLPSGSWRVQQYIQTVDGKRQYKSFTAATKKEAEYAAAEYARDYKRKQEPANMTVGEAIDRYIENRSAVLSPSTVRGYKQCRKLYFPEKLICTTLDALNQESIQCAINEMATKLSPKTVRNAHGLLTASLAAYHPDFVLRTKLPAKVRNEIVVPEKSDIQRLLEATEGTLLAAVIYLGATLGLRRSEMCALTWDDVDEGNCRISINKALVQNSARGWDIKSPKSYAGSRILDVPKGVMDKLASLQKDNARLIPITPNAVACRFDRTVKRLGLHIRLHDLRHYNASVMLSLGVPDKYAMERMGHATTNMLKTVYQHTMQEKRSAVNDQINAYFEDLT